MGSGGTREARDKDDGAIHRGASEQEINDEDGGNNDKAFDSASNGGD